MAVGTLAPSPVLQVSDSNGNPLPGAQLFTYQSGTSTPSPVFTDAALAVPYTNPAIANAGGFYYGIYMGASAQKWILKDASGVTQWTVDPVTSTSLTSGGGIVGSVLYAFEGDAQTPIANTTYVVGGTVDTTHAGTSLYVVDSVAIPSGTYALQAMIAGTGGANTVSVALMDLDTAPNTPIAVASGSSAVGIQVTSATVVFTAPGAAKRYGIKVLVSAGVGYAWSANLLRTS